jgi:hypothetical protein
MIRINNLLHPDQSISNSCIQTVSFWCLENSDDFHDENVSFGPQQVHDDVRNTKGNEDEASGAANHDPVPCWSRPLCNHCN